MATSSFDLTVHLHGAVGVGSVETLPELLDSRPAVIVTDNHLATSQAVSAVSARLPAAISIVLEAGEPTGASVTGLAGQLGGDETLVAVGGGSILDTAKLAAALIGTGSTVERHLLSAVPFTASLPVVAVPTTAGTGAEVTRTCVLTVDGHKTWAWDDLLRPGSVVLDPTLTVGMPRPVTVATGLDAFVHAVEAATAQRRDDLATEAAMWAIAELDDALPAAVADPGDLEARGRALAASTAAGLAIDRCATGIGHGLGHALGSLIPIPHGLAVALSLWSAAAFNEGSGDGRCGAVARALASEGYADAIGDFVENLGLPDLIRPLAESHPLDAATLAVETLSQVNAPMCSNNVRPAGPEEVRYLAGGLAARWEALGGRR